MTSASDLALCEKIVEVSHRLYQRQLLTAADGNISFRVNDDHIWITPSGVSKAHIQPNEMALIQLDGKVLRGNPSSEKHMHLAIYQKCSKARAVVHAHPPVAIAWSIARPELSELPSDCLSEVILAAGSIPFVPYARPGSIDMGQALIPFLPQHRALILSRHGAVTWGEDLDEAHRGMERIENSAQILAHAQQLGGIHALPKEEVLFLRQMRQQIGEKLL